MFVPVAAISKHDRSFDRLPPQPVRHRGHSTLQHIGKFHNLIFDFKRSDTVTSGFYHIIHPSYIPEISIFIHIGSIPCVVITVIPYRIRLFLIPIIALKQSIGNVLRGLHHDFSLLAKIRYGTIGAHDRDVIKGT